MHFYKRIFVAVDGSRESNYAFEKAMTISKRNPGSMLTAIHVLDKTYKMGISEVVDHTYLNESLEFSERLIEFYTEKAEAEGIECEIKLKEGSPSSALLQEFKNLKEDDLVICGSSNLGRIGRLLLGSVSNNIVNYSSCDVLVVRTPEAVMNDN